MDRKTRDFYHIQDKVDLCWRYADSGGMVDVAAIRDIEKQIAALTIDLEPLSSPISQLLDLYNQKISIIQGLLKTDQRPGEEDQKNEREAIGDRRHTEQLRYGILFREKCRRIFGNRNRHVSRNNQL